MIEQLESMEPDKEAVALKDYVVALKLTFEGNDEENHNAKLGTSQGHNAVDEDQSATTSNEVGCSGLLGREIIHHRAVVS